MTKLNVILLTCLALAVAFVPTAVAKDEAPDSGEATPIWAGGCPADAYCLNGGADGEPVPGGAPVDADCETCDVTETPLLLDGSENPDMTACGSPEPGVICWKANEMPGPEAQSGPPANNAEESVGADDAARTVPSPGVLVLGVALIGAALIARRRK